MSHSPRIDPHLHLQHPQIEPLLHRMTDCHVFCLRATQSHYLLKFVAPTDISRRAFPYRLRQHFLHYYVCSLLSFVQLSAFGKTQLGSNGWNKASLNRRFHYHRHYRSHRLPLHHSPCDTYSLVPCVPWTYTRCKSCLSSDILLRNGLSSHNNNIFCCRFRFVA